MDFLIIRVVALVSKTLSKPYEMSAGCKIQVWMTDPRVATLENFCRQTEAEQLVKIVMRNVQLG
jgi:hypothetical protein